MKISARSWSNLNDYFKNHSKLSFSIVLKFFLCRNRNSSASFCSSVLPRRYAPEILLVFWLSTRQNKEKWLVWVRTSITCFLSDYQVKNNTSFKLPKTMKWSTLKWSFTGSGQIHRWSFLPLTSSRKSGSSSKRKLSVQLQLKPSWRDSSWPKQDSKSTSLPVVVTAGGSRVLENSRKW